MIMGCGKGYNTMGEMLAIWVLFYYASLLKIPIHQICGDFKVVIDWLESRGRLKVASLEGWQRKIYYLLPSFGHL